MSRKERMLSYLPADYAETPEMQAIVDNSCEHLDELSDTIDDLLNQLFIESATWGLNKWEEELDILPIESDLEYRRKRAISKSTNRTPANYRAIEREINRYLKSPSSNVRLIEGRYAFRVSFPLVDIHLWPSKDMKSTVEEMKPAHMKALYALRDVILINQKVAHNISNKIGLKTSSNPWSQAGLGNTADEILLDGEYLLDGNRFLNGFYNKDGPAHMQQIKLASKVLHEFGVHEVNIMPSLDGEFHLDGEILLQNEPQNKKLVVLHDARMRYTQREIIKVSNQHSVPIKVSTSTSNGVATLDGQVNLDGTMSLDQALYNHSGLFRVKKDGETVEEVAI